MKTTINYELTDYMAMARLVHDSASNENEEYSVEYKEGGYTLILDISHEIEYRDEIGGSYGGYDFERLGVIDNEGYDVDDANCYDAEGNEMNTDFSAKRLLDIIN